MKRVIVTGGTGFVGRHLVEALVRRGDRVLVLSREPASARVASGVDVASWQPQRRGPWVHSLEGADAVVHLAGAPALGRRWTESAKQEIYDSRVRSTQRIVEALAEARARPQTFISASAVGYYGPREPDETLDESASAGDDFMARVVQAWESAADAAAGLGVRVVKTRFGVVLGEDGGALPKMVMPFKAFVGGPIGSGRQVVSWIHIDDLVRIVLRCMDDDAIEGPVNVTAPHPVSNEVLSDTIGRALHRPSAFRAPSLALKLAFGQGADPLLEGQRVTPAKLAMSGYEWRYPRVERAVEESLAAM